MKKKKQKLTKDKLDPDIRQVIDLKTKLLIHDCITCGLRFGIPESFYNEAIKQFGSTFFCPAGHPMYNTIGRKRALVREAERKAEKQKEEIAQKAQEDALKKEREEVESQKPGLIKRILFFKIW